MNQPASDITIDVFERTKGFGGHPAESMNRRLFMQLWVFDVDRPAQPSQSTKLIAAQLAGRGASGVVYEDTCNPRALGLLTWSEHPEDFISKVRPIFEHADLATLKLQPNFTMLGRSYATGYEPDLEYYLFRRPIETVTNETWPWAVWYPLRRRGGFDRMDPKERGGILREHAEIGKAYGAADLAHDVRLACHGLDANDNEFVIGLISKDLHPLSHVVQRMRQTRQTAEYINQMGPFFVGYACERVVSG